MCSTPISSWPSTWSPTWCCAAGAAADDVEIERDVVLEEIAMRDDDPEDTLGDVFLSAMFGEHPVGRPVIGSVESISAMTRAQLHSFHHAPLHAGADGRRGGGKHRPRRGRGAGARALRPAAGSRPNVGAAAQGHRPGAGPSESAAGQPRRGADPSVAGRADAGSALGASLGAVGAQHRARRRAEFASVPTDSGDARAGVLGVFDGGHVLRQRCAVGLRRVPAGAVRRGRPGDHRRAGRRGRATASPRPNAGSPRARCAVGWCSAWRTPDRG